MGVFLQARGNTPDRNLMGVKQEPEEDSTFSQQPKETGEPPLSSNADIPSAGQKAEKQELLRFNKWTYIAELRRSEKWDTMSEKEKANRKAEALARYHHYREERLRMGDIEERDDDDEEEEIQKTSIRAFEVRYAKE
ncbi:uncharacterized protein N7496_010680 [Penicillium cataractarum]|uniref:Uncharacterized protein n=1 Tax=Penicillium cataractarum TaxID=2100454 RepID=A0A9W9RRJ8_9EURO|nr:uncharacterized protein N7496_010680 [Penicillium cataractarum]KAJ5364967.1 hypothetical protein N7496_010680 [Penicillium cataractarum]